VPDADALCTEDGVVSADADALCTEGGVVSAIALLGELEGGGERVNDSTWERLGVHDITLFELVADDVVVSDVDKRVVSLWLGVVLSAVCGTMDADRVSLGDKDVVGAADDCTSVALSELLKLQLWEFEADDDGDGDATLDRLGVTSWSEDDVVVDDDVVVAVTRWLEERVPVWLTDTEGDTVVVEPCEGLHDWVSVGEGLVLNVATEDTVPDRDGVALWLVLLVCVSVVLRVCDEVGVGEAEGARDCDGVRVGDSV
jgi:hypothetical protein